MRKHISVLFCETAMPRAKIFIMYYNLVNICKFDFNYAGGLKLACHRVI
jgi:hypothetical protein